MRPHLWAVAAAAVVAGILLLVPKPVDGQAPVFVPTEPSRFGMDIVVHGVSQPVYRLSGQGYVEGHMGERYSVRLYNHSGSRVEAVVAVDGRDAMDGGAAQTSKRGYVLGPYATTQIDGFRLSLDEVAAFRFTTVGDSYASRMGTPWSVGTVSASFFPERVIRPRPLRSVEAPSAGAEPRSRRGSARDESSQNLGTEFGERRQSPVQETAFVRQNPSWPAARVALRYNDRRGLCSIGVESLCDHVPWPPMDPYDPYPAASPRRFSTPPPGWSEPLDDR
jgi:hypothetical protein